MDYPLTIPAILRRARDLHHAREVVSRRPDGTLARTTYGAVAERAQRLAVALQGLGLGAGDFVATFCWNHAEHLEAYLAVPSFGGIVTPSTCACTPTSSPTSRRMQATAP